jgi:hypothetical protein
MNDELRKTEENLYTPDCIRTFSGKYVNVFEPTLEMIDIEDIAHALSNQPRFGGHLPKFYSVAQHCVMCSELIEEPFKLGALMHDASEAYLLDIPSPIKHRLPNYKILEDQMMMLISDKFGLKDLWSLEVKNIDRFMLQMEWDVLMLQGPDSDRLKCWAPPFAKRRFLELFYQLKANHSGSG